MTRLCTLMSGSSGNCVLVSHKGTNLLVDCGISGRQAAQCLSSLDLCPSQIDYILVTHEHIDHIRGVGILSRRFDIPVVASRGTWEGMDIGETAAKNQIVLDERGSFDLCDIGVIPFALPHDANQPTGFRFDLGGKAAAVATDIGHVTDGIKKAVAGCEAVLLEANYDADMLENGTYPYPLKQRIKGLHGHLCNEEAAELAVFLAKHGTRRLILGHLSKENNSENLAFATVARHLEYSGIHVGRDILMSVAPRYQIGRVMGL